MTKMTGFIMRRYLKSADPIALSDGNVFTTVDYGMSTHGGFGLPGEPKSHRKYHRGRADHRARGRVFTYLKSKMVKKDAA
jgi:hypothetical protein